MSVATDPLADATERFKRTKGSWGSAKGRAVPKSGGECAEQGEGTWGIGAVVPQGIGDVVPAVAA